MSASAIWAVIVGMAIANFLVRFVPIAVVSRAALPSPVVRWLSYVPVSVMGALVAGTVLRPEGRSVVPWANPWLLASAVTVIAYLRTRSFLGATVIGMFSFVVLRSILGA